MFQLQILYGKQGNWENTVFLPMNKMKALEIMAMHNQLWSKNHCYRIIPVSWFFHFLLTLFPTIMRKIESQMIDAIKSETDWKSGNTKVVNFFNDSDKCVVASVFLHGNKIAEITDTDMTIFDGGWQSVTTKSRLNALCDEFCIAGEGVFQENFAWYVRKFVGAINGQSKFVIETFSNGYTFA